MQTRQIIRLARKLRSTHRKNKSWRLTSKVCLVFTPDGRCNPGLAKRIALDGYQPSDDVVQRLIAHGAIEIKKKHPRVICKDLFDETDDALLRALRERQTMPESNVNPKIMREFLRACKHKPQARVTA